MLNAVYDSRPHHVNMPESIQFDGEDVGVLGLEVSLIHFGSIQENLFLVQPVGMILQATLPGQQLLSAVWAVDGDNDPSHRWPLRNAVSMCR